MAPPIQQNAFPQLHQVSSMSLLPQSTTMRPVSMTVPELHNGSPQLHQVSSLSPLLQPTSTNASTSPIPWGPASFGARNTLPTPSSLPEVAVQPRSFSYDPANDFPIPVIQDQQPPVNLSKVWTNPISLPAYLEEHRQVPYPPTWRPPPVMATFYASNGSKALPGSDWLSQQESFTWRTIRPTEHAYNPAAPSYTFNFTNKAGSFRDPKFSWSMLLPEQPTDPKKKVSKSKQTAWTYDLRLDKNKGVRKSEVLSHGKDKAILTTYVHAQNYDSLRFIGPDGRAYMWVSSSRVSSTNGSRYDTIRHALFVEMGQIKDPLYGEIVADHTFWDGYVDENEVHTGIKCDGCQKQPIKGRRWKCKTCHHHDVCEECRKAILSGGFGPAMQQACDLSLVCLPDEALCIRSASVDPALVVATLQVLKDWERHTMREEKKKDPSGFMASEDAARKQDLGIMSYWKASDWDKKEKKNTANEKMGTVVKARSTEAIFEGPSSALGGLVDAGFALAGHGTHGGGGHSAGGGDGGGGGS
jgi:hypothetical protein